MRLPSDMEADLARANSWTSWWYSEQQPSGQDSTVLMCRSCQGPYAGHHKQLPFQASSHEHCMVSRHVKVLKVLHELEEVVPCPRPGDFRT